MRRISLSVSDRDYEQFRALARRRDRSIAELIREAMASYLRQGPDELSPLRRLRVFDEPRPVEVLPDRSELWDEMTTDRLDRRDVEG